MEVKLRISPLDMREQILVVIHLELGVKTALHQDSRSAERQRLIDFAEDRLERLHVSLRRPRRPIESAKRAVFRAEIRVVDVPVYLVGDHVARMNTPAERISLHSYADQVVGTKHVESLSWC